MKPATQPAERPIVATVTRAAPPAGSGQESPRDGLNDLPTVGEFTRLALWMAGSVAGLTTAVHAAQGRHFRGMAKRLGWSAAPRPPRRATQPPAPDATMGLLADALVGTTRQAIASVYGQPRCAVDGRDVLTGGDVWDGRIWYFPLSHPAASLVGVEFDAERQHATRVVFVSMDALAA